jgi:hypothetical protein
VKKAAHGFYGVGRSAADALERMVNGVRVSEDVMGRFPIGMLVGGAKARYPERRRIGECSTKVSRRGPIACCRGERINDFGRIVAEKAIG